MFGRKMKRQIEELQERYNALSEITKELLGVLVKRGVLSFTEKGMLQYGNSWWFKSPNCNKRVDLKNLQETQEALLQHFELGTEVQPEQPKKLVIVPLDQPEDTE